MPRAAMTFPSNVQWIEKGTKDLTGDHTVIMFGPGHSLTVRGTVEQVTIKLTGKRLKLKKQRRCAGRRKVSSGFRSEQY